MGVRENNDTYLTVDTDGESDAALASSDLPESAVIRRLADNWYRRAAVKRPEPDLDQLFNSDRPDYPPHILPFATHHLWLAATPEKRSRVLSWAWIAFNRRTVTGEQQLANPAFELVLEDAFPGASSFKTRQAVAQAMVDEQYHILMHRQASDLTRHKRKLALPEGLLPETYTNLEHQRMRDATSDGGARNLITLAFATVSEVSINAYLGLLAHDSDVQPINTATVRTHLRDEYCHAEICSEIAKTVYESLTRDRKKVFLASLSAALEAFVATDYSTWERILEVEKFPQAELMMGDVRHDPAKSRLLRDYSGLYSLFEELDVLDQVDFDWKRSETTPQEKIVSDDSDSTSG